MPYLPLPSATRRAVAPAVQVPAPHEDTAAVVINGSGPSECNCILAAFWFSLQI